MNRELLEIESQLTMNLIALDVLPAHLDQIDNVTQSMKDAPVNTTNVSVVNATFDVLAMNLGFDNRSDIGMDGVLSGEGLVGAAKGIASKIYEGIAAALAKAAELIGRFVNWVLGLFGKNAQTISSNKAAVKSAADKQEKAISSSSLKPGEKVDPKDAKDAGVLVDQNGKVVDPKTVAKNLQETVSSKKLNLDPKKSTNRENLIRKAFTDTAVQSKSLDIARNIEDGVIFLTSFISANPWRELDGIESVYVNFTAGSLNGITAAREMLTKYQEKLLTKDLFEVKGKEIKSMPLPGLQRVQVRIYPVVNSVPKDRNVNYLKVDKPVTAKVTDSHLPKTYADLKLGTEVIEALENTQAEAQTVVEQAKATLDKLSGFTSKFGRKGELALKAEEALSQDGILMANSPAVADDVAVAKGLVKNLPAAMASAHNILKFAVDNLRNYNTAALIISEESKNVISDLSFKKV